MKSFDNYIYEEVTQRDLDNVEKYADKLFAKVGLDIEFTRHFKDRVNDERNKKPITPAELIRLFKQTYKKYGKKKLRFRKINKNFEKILLNFKRQALHAKSLGFVHPTKNKQMHFESNLPKDFKKMLDFLEKFAN